MDGTLGFEDVDHSSGVVEARKTNVTGQVTEETTLLKVHVFTWHVLRLD